MCELCNLFTELCNIRDTKQGRFTSLLIHIKKSFGLIKQALNIYLKHTS